MAIEGFETGSKTAYAAADVTLGTGVWNMDDALIGTSTSDIKNGIASTRVRNSGKITMKFNLIQWCINHYNQTYQIRF
jgi:endonuclease G